MFAVLVGGWRWLPGVAFASWLGNHLLIGWSAEWALWITVGNTLAPLLSKAILQRFTPDASLPLDSGRSVALFSLVAVLNAILSAGFGAQALHYGSTNELPLDDAFFSWFVSDLAAILLLTPSMLLWWRDAHQPCELLRGDGEMWLAATSLIVVTSFLFFSPPTDATSLLRTGTFMILLPLVWVALRFPQRSTFTLMATVFVISVLGTWLEKGVLTQLTAPYTRLQIILITISLITLLVSAMSVERRRVMDALSLSYATLEDRVKERTLQLSDNLKHLEMLLDNLPVPMVITRPDKSIVIYANLAAADYGGYSLNKMIGSSSMNYFHNIDDFHALKTRLEEHGSLNSHEVALRHRDGHTLWALLSAVPSWYNDIPVVIFAFQDISEAKQRELNLETMVSTDALTQVATRRHFMQRAEEVRLLAERQGQPFALFMLDLDHFKSINDTYGHRAGDHVLARVAQTFRLSLRPGDLCGRLGGEEFAVILSNTTRHAAEVSAERLRQAIHALHIHMDNGSTVIPSVSIGACIYYPSGTEPDTPCLGTRSVEEMIELADQALYRAKQSGRNRVVFAHELKTSETSQHVDALAPRLTRS